MDARVKPAHDDSEEASRPPALRVPVTLEVANEPRREMAIGLFARIDGEIVAEHVERFLADADGATVAGRAHHAGASEAGNHALDAGIHGAGLHDLVADEPAV